MTHEAKTVLEHYLNVTYASHDTAMVLREAKHALCVLCTAANAKLYLFRGQTVWMLLEQPDGTYTLAQCGDEISHLKAAQNALFLCARTEVQEYGVVLLEGEHVYITDYAKRLVHVLGEQLHTGLLGNELDMMMNNGRRLVPEDGSLPADTLAVLAHEMRAPVATALVSLEVIRHRMRETSDDGFAVLCDTLEQNLRRSMRMSTNLLLASKAVTALQVWSG